MSPDAPATAIRERSNAPSAPRDPAPLSYPRPIAIAVTPCRPSRSNRVGRTWPELQDRPAAPTAHTPRHPEDDEALGRLDRATWSTLHAVTPRPRPPYEPFFSERFGPRRPLVAETETAGSSDTSGSAVPTPLASQRARRQIQGLAVADEARGTGVGRRCCGPR